VSHNPTPAAILIAALPGFHAACGTRTSNWRRRRSTVVAGVGAFMALVVASRSSAVVPCTVRNSSAGDLTPAACGQARAVAEEPSAIVNAVRAGSLRLFTVTRNAVAPGTGFTRSSTRSAALPAYTGSVGYVSVPFFGENKNSAGSKGSLGSLIPIAPWSS
jgi:hypothetical protein